MHLNPELEGYIRASQQELLQLIRDLCAISAPSHHEERRAAFCRDWFERNGGRNVIVDEALNVICPHGDMDGELIVFMAHTDTVFPDMEPMPLTEAEGRMYCPGVTDDTANLAVMMICARYMLKQQLPRGLGMLFVANSCEEGLGNLKGCRRIMEVYGSRIRELVTLDGTNLRDIVSDSVGSHRYRVTVRTEGGHSFGDFGKPNAIHHLSAIISTLYSIGVPVEGNSKTTYNVGLISGGTSVNTIAQQAEMLYEYRSDHVNCLRLMEEKFHEVIGHYRRAGIDVDVELIGERPCAAGLKPDAQQALLKRCARAVRSVGLEAVFSSGSTDANIPLSMGIPAACISVCNGGKCHTREEWLDATSLADGCRLFMHLLYSYLS